MPIEVHRLVQESDDLNRTIAAHPIEHDVPGISTWLFDVVAKDPRPARRAVFRTWDRRRYS